MLLFQIILLQFFYRDDTRIQRITFLVLNAMFFISGGLAESKEHSSLPEIFRFGFFDQNFVRISHIRATCPDHVILDFITYLSKPYVARP